ncbi:MAG: hypothetical protein AAGL68_10245, partial [Pseudomonadota bacterium]
ERFGSRSISGQNASASETFSQTIKNSHMSFIGCAPAKNRAYRKTRITQAILMLEASRNG